MPNYATFAVGLPASMDGALGFAIILTGALAASLLCLAAARVLRLDAILLAALRPASADHASVIRELRLVAEQADRSGLGTLRDLSCRIRDPFLARSLRLAASTMDNVQLGSHLDTMLDRSLAARLRINRASRAFSRIGAALAPVTLLIVIAILVRSGPVPALIPILPAAAILCVCLLSVVFLTLRLPVGGDINSAADEYLEHSLIVTAVRAIHRGESPAAVQARLLAMLPQHTDVADRAVAA